MENLWRCWRHHQGVIGVGLFLILVAALIRLLEWPTWNDPALWLAGDPFLATNDGYAWLAGLDAHGRMHDWPMARLIGALAAIMPFSPARIAFFLPLGLSALPGLLMVLLARREQSLSAALPAGVLATCGMAFLLRTRLGYPETELFALAGALGLAVFWALALGLSAAGSVQPHWRGVLLAATVAALASWAYPSGHPVLMGVILAGALGGFLAGIGPAPLMLATAGLTAALHAGLPGLAVAAGLCWLGQEPSWRTRTGLLMVLAVLVMVATLLWGHDAWLATWRRLMAYAGTVAPDGDWSLPNVAVSIRETTPESLGEYGLRLAGHWAWVLLGLAGFAYLALRRPQWLAFMPLLGLGLAGFWLGPRFALYATPVIGMGLGFGLAAWLWQRGYASRWHWTAQALLAVALLGHTAWLAKDFSASPVPHPTHARALQALAPSTPGEVAASRVWEWWDLGYAAQYFSGRPSFTDGGSTSRRHTWVLGRVLGAQTVGDAAAWMRLATEEAAEQSPNRAAYAHRPLAVLDGMKSTTARRALQAQLAERRQPVTSDSEEYLVVSWHTLRRAEWISRFARWDLVDGPTGQGRSSTLQPPVQLDEHRGLLETANGVVRLASFTLFQDGQRYHADWPWQDGAHAVINNDRGEGVLLDADLYHMMAVQMLLHPPQAFEEHFKLVVDQAPHTRIYRLR